MSDELRDAVLAVPEIAAAPARPTVPEGLWLGPVVDGVQTYFGTAEAARSAGMETKGFYGDQWGGLGRRHDAIVQCRPPVEPPAPRTERVPWWEAVGRRHADNAEEIRELRASPRGVEVWTYPFGWVVGYETGEDPLPMNGTVEVLVEDGES